MKISFDVAMKRGKRGKYVIYQGRGGRLTALNITAKQLQVRVCEVGGPDDLKCVAVVEGLARLARGEEESIYSVNRAKNGENNGQNAEFEKFRVHFEVFVELL